ncbi:MAG TPA: transglutaminase domain-containing protein [Phycisphaerae bacterium]|nr:transglutaminase domain-containing protein [Phycisphaerae bacterium]HOJ73601.1 transglutaminase domain-containing protein [Phycisphaerae bacterium]HOM51590.1 transglutaminase domain-containing protein [Phycisphaerae bacterium]HON65041.1 transglutaminase domain-containing protein [Phycisphaerae bacterium]HOQ85760.1 transglutaminase domain-containing protein [Phycisphaerae bacterium]
MASVVCGLASIAAGQGTPGTGASLAWTSTDPILVEARRLVAAGELTKAETLVTDAAATKPEARQACEEMQEIIRRLRREYSQTLDQLVAKLEKSIPDVTAADVERWREQGQVECRTFDGQIWYFRREPGHILRFCEEAKRRRDEHAAKNPAPARSGPTPDERLHAHLREVIAAAESTGKTEVVPIRHRITYKLTVKPNRPGAKPGSLLRCWLPFPQEYRQQKDIKLIRTSPTEHVVSPIATEGSYVEGSPHRTVYMERRIEDPAQPVQFEEEFEYTSFAYYPPLSDDAARPLSAGIDPRYLAERPPHIVFTPKLKETVDKVVGDEKNPLARARLIYHYVSETIPWCPEMEYTIIPSFVEKVLATGKGDCGVQSMLFITMCRYAGIPARWQSGWESKPGDTNMHDWAEFYVEPWGWLPADVSYGLQKSDDPKVREFYFGHQDAYRMIVNRDYGAPLQPAKPSLRSEPADFQRGEVELDGRNLYFDDWSYDITFDLQPLGE